MADPWRIAAMAGAIIVLGTSLAFSTAGTRPSASHPAGDAKRGEEPAQVCLTCHGATPLKYGDPPIDPPLLRGQRENYIFLALHAYGAGGRTEPTMQPFAAALDEQQMRDVAAYLAGPPKPVPTVNMAGSAGHREAIAKCGICHGETGMGEMQGMPVITGQRFEYLERALQEYRDGRRSAAAMVAVAKQTSPAEARTILRYYAAQNALEAAR
ncbi:MAG: c-type cytochrome [Hyphomonadaceae bacterium]|nr:c-type cytochrome [Hyphomonadaceae bacterium]